MKTKQKPTIKTRFPKHIAVSIVIVILASLLGVTGIVLASKDSSSDNTQTVSVKNVDSQIQADGTVGSENEAILHFQIPGKLTYLPFKEGDSVTNGQTIASLDSYTLQQQLTAAVNNLKSAQDNYDMTIQRQNAGVLEGQTRLSLDTTNKNGYSNILENDVIYQTVQALVDQNKTSLDNAQVSVAIAQDALQLTTLNAPIDGILVHEDVTTPQVNVTPATSFVIADPTKLMFKAFVSETDIASVIENAPVAISVNGVDQQLRGTVERIHPEKNTNGNYEVDITSQDLVNYAKYGQSGSVLIKNTRNTPAVVVPSWVLVDNQYVWVMAQGDVQKRKVTVGKTLGDNVEIISGLSSGDRIITDPKAVVKNKYILL